MALVTHIAQLVHGGGCNGPTSVVRTQGARPVNDGEGAPQQALAHNGQSMAYLYGT